jgi:hypothetical protein
MFTSTDLQLLVKKGIKPDQVHRQLENFRKGFPFISLVKPAVVGDGITLLQDEELDDLVLYFKQESSKKHIVKFVPASGAATRMFKDLFDFLNSLRQGKSSEPNASVGEFFTLIEKFAFWPDLKDAVAKKGKDIKELLEQKNYEIILSAFLEEKGMNYGALPKGLLGFHASGSAFRTPFEEHLVEAAFYARDASNHAHLHFTVSPEHLAAFKKRFDTSVSQLEKSLNIKFLVEYSIQKPATDTIAADLSNEPFRETDGSLVFRPGGHGALLENLNAVDADIIFIKNIDNVVPDHLKDETIRYKMALGGLLLRVQDQIFKLGRRLEVTAEPPPELITGAVEFLRKTFAWNPEQHPLFQNDPRTTLLEALRKPVRICGMVKNEGEPGGGPFWVNSENGTVTLQIVESSQMDLKNPLQMSIAAGATHFNPVDLVCAVKDWNGKPYDLLNFRDPGTGFIAVKSKDGRELKAQELPGLWNGAMAWWNTIFVEVPQSSFNPVKTVNDLLRPAHQ